jgi:hypothetical protein
MGLPDSWQVHFVFFDIGNHKKDNPYWKKES